MLFLYVYKSDDMKSGTTLSTGSAFLLALAVVSAASFAARIYEDVRIANLQAALAANQTTEVACQVGDDGVLVR